MKEGLNILEGECPIIIFERINKDGADWKKEEEGKKEKEGKQRPWKGRPKVGPPLSRRTNLCNVLEDRCRCHLFRALAIQ
jgi:hypothetical protein